MLSDKKMKTQSKQASRTIKWSKVGGRVKQFKPPRPPGKLLAADEAMTTGDSGLHADTLKDNRDINTREILNSSGCEIEFPADFQTDTGCSVAERMVGRSTFI